VVDQAGGAPLGEGVAQLEVTLLAVIEGFSGGERAEAKALAGDEHDELAGDFVVGRQIQGAGRADQLTGFAVEVEHGSTPSEGKGTTTGENVAASRHAVQRMMAEGKRHGRAEKGNRTLFSLENKNRSTLMRSGSATMDWPSSGSRPHPTPAAVPCPRPLGKMILAEKIPDDKRSPGNGRAANPPSTQRDKGNLPRSDGPPAPG
jgi:hypothetical protein